MQMCKADPLPLSWHRDIHLKEMKAWILLFNNITDFWPGMCAAVADSFSSIFTIYFVMESRGTFRFLKRNACHVRLRPSFLHRWQFFPRQLPP